MRARNSSGPPRAHRTIFQNALHRTTRAPDTSRQPSSGLMPPRLEGPARRAVEHSLQTGDVLIGGLPTAVIFYRQSPVIRVAASFSTCHTTIATQQTCSETSRFDRGAFWSQVARSLAQDSHWIDAATRAIVVEIPTLTPNTRVLTATRILFEFSPTGRESSVPSS